MKVVSLDHAPNSFRMQDPELVFASLELREGNTFLDLGCGGGNFSLKAAEIVGENGTVFAQDTQKTFADLVVEEGARRGLRNIHSFGGDLCGPLPFEPQSIDACLVAQVLHTVLHRPEGFVTLFRNARRFLVPGGRLVTIECKKTETHRGPPAEVRLEPEELIEPARHCGLEVRQHIDLGFSYLLCFTNNQAFLS